MAISVHDNFIVSYEVLCDGHEIRMRTEFRDKGEPFERTLVVFRGAEAYDFQHDCFGNIIFSIEEVPAESILTERFAEFQEGQRHGWPPCFRGSLDEGRAYLRDQGVRGFLLSSSYGMSGWVLAREMSMTAERQCE